MHCKVEVRLYNKSYGEAKDYHSDLIDHMAVQVSLLPAQITSEG